MAEQLGRMLELVDTLDRFPERILQLVHEAVKAINQSPHLIMGRIMQSNRQIGVASRHLVQRASHSQHSPTDAIGCQGSPREYHDQQDGTRNPDDGQGSPGSLIGLFNQCFK